MIKNIRQILWSVPVLFSLMVISACSAAGSNKPAPAIPQATLAQTQAAESETFTDPFSYCAAVGTIDQPDERYTGEKISDTIIKGFIKAAELQASSEPSDVFKQSTIWRCMDHNVYVCNFGANLPCDSKANTDREPTQAMLDYCKEFLDSDFIPMAVTGHTTIYSWHCVKDAPELLDQIDQADAAGYLSRIWYRINPNP